MNLLSNYPPGADTDDAPFNAPDYDDVPYCEKCYTEFDFWVDVDDFGRDLPVAIGAVETAEGLICEECEEDLYGS